MHLLSTLRLQNFQGMFQGNHSTNSVVRHTDMKTMLFIND
jgi:hypothetical protein